MEKYRVNNPDGSFVEYASKELVPDGASYETITFEASNNIVVPEQLSRMKFIIQVFLTTGKKYEEIVAFIVNLPIELLDDVSKYIILTRLRGCTHFERYSSDLIMISQMMEISDAQLDEIFINGNNIQ